MKYVADISIRIADLRKVEKRVLTGYFYSRLREILTPGSFPKLDVYLKVVRDDDVDVIELEISIEQTTRDKSEGSDLFIRRSVIAALKKTLDTDLESLVNHIHQINIEPYEQ